MLISELQHWSKLLIALGQDPSDPHRGATCGALRLHGLPEAPVLLATAAIAEAKTATVLRRQTELMVSESKVDLGILRGGEAGTAQLQVQGGPGYVVVDSDELRVTPMQFGPGSTRVTVSATA